MPSGTADRTPVRARVSSAAISSSVNMPGISMSCSMPFIFILWRVDVASGTGRPRSRSQGLHRRDLVALADDDPLAEDRDVRARAVRRRPAGHDHGLRVMRNHARHEVHVGVAVRKPPRARAAWRADRTRARSRSRRPGQPRTGVRRSPTARQPSSVFSRCIVSDSTSTCSQGDNGSDDNGGDDDGGDGGNGITRRNVYM